MQCVLLAYSRSKRWLLVAWLCLPVRALPRLPTARTHRQLEVRAGALHCGLRRVLLATLGFGCVQLGAPVVPRTAGWLALPTAVSPTVVPPSFDLALFA